MKSLSLDSPECAPSSPVHSRRMLTARVGRMSSVELPDEPDKSLSSNSASPCPSPVKQMSKHQRLLPTNLYVVLYNFKSRHADELDLKAGYKVTVIDTSDPDWWKGKCLGKIGYFPSKYCTKLQAGERALQVTHNLQVSDGDTGMMLLRDQIVIQVGEEVDGMMLIRSGDNRQAKRGSLTDDTIPIRSIPKTIRSAPVTPCDSETSTWSDRNRSKHGYDLSPGYATSYGNYEKPSYSYDKSGYEASYEASTSTASGSQSKGNYDSGVYEKDYDTSYDKAGYDASYSSRGTYEGSTGYDKGNEAGYKHSGADYEAEGGGASCHINLGSALGLKIWRQ
ncbi:unnamed protein product [Spodoptera exigua]|nr:unnamed protein product [Spodoptera exigua]